MRLIGRSVRPQLEDVALIIPIRNEFCARRRSARISSLKNCVRRLECRAGRFHRLWRWGCTRLGQGRAEGEMRQAAE